MTKKIERARRVRLLIPGAMASIIVAGMYVVALGQLQDNAYCRFVVLVSGWIVPYFVLSKITNWMMKAFQDAPTKNTDEH